MPPKKAAKRAPRVVAKRAKPAAPPSSPAVSQEAPASAARATRSASRLAACSNSSREPNPKSPVEVPPKRAPLETLADAKAAESHANDAPSSLEVKAGDAADANPSLPVEDRSEATPSETLHHASFATAAGLFSSSPGKDEVEVAVEENGAGAAPVETLEPASLDAAADSNASPSSSSGKVRVEDSAEISSRPAPESVVCTESMAEENMSNRDAEKGEQHVREETLADATTVAECHVSCQTVDEKTRENVLPEAASSEPGQKAVGSEPGQKPATRKTVRVVKKLVKKKVIKKVPRSAVEALRRQAENSNVLKGSENSNSITVGSSCLGENPISSSTADEQLGKVDAPGCSEISNPLVNDSGGNVDNLDNPEVQNDEHPEVQGHAEVQVAPENRGGSMLIEVENPSSDVTVLMNIENHDESVCCDGLKDGSTGEIPLKANDLSMGEAQYTENGVTIHMSGNDAAAEFSNVNSTDEHKEPVDLDNVKVMEEVEKHDTSGVPKGCETSSSMMVLSEEMEALERKKRRKTELFIGGLDKDAKEADIRKVFEEAGNVVEVRLVMKGQTGKNKGYAFLRYSTAAEAKKALEKYSKVKICGKECGTSAVEGNDTIFLGNLDKKWKNEDVMKLLHDAGIEKIDTLTVMPDPGNAECNRGFAFLEFETNRDAEIAYKKLQKVNVFGKHVKIKVAWAAPLTEPDEEEMQKVKSVYAEFVPSSWDEEKVREFFKRFGKVEGVVLARNLPSAKRKDFAFVHFTTREAALLCIESFTRELSDDEGSKVNMKVSLAKPPKGKQNRRASSSISKETNKEKPQAATRRIAKPHILTNKGKNLVPAHSSYQALKSDRSSSTNAEVIQLLRDQALRKQSHAGFGSVNPDYGYSSSGRKRPAQEVPLYSSDPRGYLRARVESSYPVPSSSYDSVSLDGGMTSVPYYRRPSNYGSGYELPSYTRNLQREDAHYRGSGGSYQRYY